MKKILAQNKKAEYLYDIKERLEAGIELKGFEVKAVKQGKINLSGGHIRIKNGEAFLIGVKIGRYQPANIPSEWQEDRPRRLLLKKREILRLQGLQQQAGLTIIPLSVYTNKAGLIKIEIAVAKGKKKRDRREKLKKRSLERETRRAFKARFYKF